MCWVMFDCADKLEDSNKIIDDTSVLEVMLYSTDGIYWLHWIP